MKREDALKLADHALDELNDALKQGRSDTFKRFLEVAAPFPRYSFRNVMMIMAQQPDVTRVAGFQTWKQLGRTVRRGERGIAIVAPIPNRKKVELQADDTTESDGHPLFGFRIVHVFDISQTDGEELAEFATPQGEPRDRLRHLEQVIRDSHVDLIYDRVPGGGEGASMNGTIIVSPGLSPAETFCTLVHELAHERLHQHDRDTRPSCTVRETEAEAVAHVVCHACGINTTTHSSDYIQLYNGNTETLAASLKSIQSTAAWIIMELARAEAADGGRVGQLVA